MMQHYPPGQQQQQQQQQSLPAHLLHLARTASANSLATASAFVSHFVHGPPHSSWSWQMTTMRAALRSALLHNPPSEPLSMGIVRTMTKVTYPTVPGKFVYHPCWWLFHPWLTASYRPPSSTPSLAAAAADDSNAALDPRVQALLDLQLISHDTDRLMAVSAEWVLWNGLEEALRNRIFRSMDASYFGLVNATDGDQASADAQQSGGDPLLQDTKVILYVHGGAFHLLSARTHRCITAKLSEVTGYPVLALNQRLGPENNFAAAIEDTILMYLALIGERPRAKVYTGTEQPLASLNFGADTPSLDEVASRYHEQHCERVREKQREYEKQHRKWTKMQARAGVHAQVPPPPTVRDFVGPVSVGDYLSNAVLRPDQIIFCGDSSGGNTVAAALIALKSAGYPVPGAAILFSPWLDPPSTAESWQTNSATCFLPADLPGVQEGFLHFCKPYYPTHPLVAPFYATREMLTGLPPILIQLGDSEALVDEGIEWGLCINRVGGKCRVEVYDGGMHVFHAFRAWNKTREAAFTNVASWLAKWSHGQHSASAHPDTHQTTQFVPHEDQPALSQSSSTSTLTGHVDEVKIGTVALEEDEKQKVNDAPLEDIIVRFRAL
ncbi:hypothetical protein RI367_004693 [Sorochytrium milnesiophthora]